MNTGALGKIYPSGTDIIRQGEVGECMYVIQEGKVEILLDKDGEEFRIGVREEGEFVGEMALFDRELRSATVRALGEVRVLTVDKRNLLSRIHTDPTLAFRLIETMSHRIRELNKLVNKLRGAEGRGAPVVE